MFTKNFLHTDMRELEHEIQYRCFALELDFNDPVQVHRFAHDMLQNMAVIKAAAERGEHRARVQAELFGLAMLMHRTSMEMFGPAYLAQFEELTQEYKAWPALAKALWQELETRNIDNE
jgi:hypothetical protein